MVDPGEYRSDGMGPMHRVMTPDSGEQTAERGHDQVKWG